MNSPFHLNETTSNYLPTRPLSKQDIVDKAKEIVSSDLHQDSECLCDPQTVRDYLQLNLGQSERETFGCIFLDTRHRVISFEILFIGTIDKCVVYPREIVKTALNHNAAAVILAHNHPSGTPEPSEADRCITNQLQKALKLVDIRLLDHFIVGEGEPMSFAERGLL